LLPSSVSGLAAGGGQINGRRTSTQRLRGLSILEVVGST
jgi:hypothetical protein